MVHNQLNKLYCGTHVKLWSFFIWCIYTCSYFICHILYSYLNGITKDFLHVFPSDYVYLSYRKSTNKHPSPVSLIPTIPPIFLKMIDINHDFKDWSSMVNSLAGIRICVLSSVALPPTKCAWVFPLCVLFLYHQLQKKNKCHKFLIYDILYLPLLSSQR